MFAIIHIHSDGGASSVSGETLEIVQAKCRALCPYFTRACVAATAPFEARPADDGVGWDVTMPAETQEALGEALMKLYGQAG